MQTSKHSWIFKIALLSISTLLSTAAVISPVIPDMLTAFPDQPKAVVETLLTVPNFGIIFSLFLSPILIKYIGKKPTILIGLTIALISGILPIFVADFTTILAARFTFGAGIGLFNSLAVSLLPEFFEGDELASMMGFQSMAGSLGSAILSFSLSYLITLGWQQSFYVYLIILPIIFIFATFIKLTPKVASTNQAGVIAEEKIRFNLPVVGIALLMFTLFGLFMTSVIKLPELILSSGIGTASSVSIISGISTLVGLPVGILYGAFYKKMNRMILPIGLLTVTCGFFVLSMAPNLLVLIAGVLMTGIGFGSSIPYIYTWTAEIAPKNAINISYTLLLITINIGVFCSPLLLNAFAAFFNNYSPAFSMMVAGTGFLLLFIFITLKTIAIKRKEIKVEGVMPHEN